MKPALDKLFGEIALLATVLRGLLGPTLSNEVGIIEKTHFRQNATLRSHRHSMWMRCVAWVKRHPLVSVAIVALTYALAMAIAWWQPLPGPPPPVGIEDYFRDFQSANAAILGAQASFIGIVFPLVIAFVGLLNQGRASFATRLTIYVEETAAVFVGVSSLLLCVVIVTQMPLSGQLLVRVAASATVLNILWFAINVAALGYFIFKTIDYLHPAKRSPITKAYVANVAWRREFRDIVTQNRWLGASHYGYLPAGDETGLARVWYSPLFDGVDVAVSKKLRVPMIVADVRFGILAPVIRHWLSQASSRNGPSGQDIAFPLLPNTEYKGTPVVARSSFALGTTSRLAILAAFRFKRDLQDPAAISDTARLLKEMIADLLALIDQRQADEFGAQLTLIHDFHAFLFAIAQAPAEDFNYAQMETDFVGRLGEKWASEYRDMQRRATERLADEPEFFGRCAYLGAHIYGRCEGITPSALKSLLLIPNNLFHHLMVWALNELRTEGGQPPNAGGSFTLRRREDNYATAWRHLVAGWERLLQTIAHPLGEAEWSRLQRVAPNITEHLRMTALMVGRAAWSGDVTAINWSTDLLLNWITLAQRSWDEQGETWWALQREGLTVDMLDLEWPTITAMPLMATEDLKPTSRAVFAGIMRNAWRDSVVALASVLIHWSIEFGTEGTAARAAGAMLRNRRHDDGDAGGFDDDGPLTATATLAAILRIVGSGGRFSQSSYAAMFEGLAESLDGMREEPGVSMRIYSSSGGLGFSALYAEHALAIMAAGGDAQLDNAIRRMVTQDQDDALRRREEYLKGLTRALDEEINPAAHETLFNVLKSPSQTFAESLQAAKQLAHNALQTLLDHRLRAIQTAPLDQRRMREIALAASSGAFKPTHFPLNLFTAITATRDQLTTYTVRVGNQDKGAYTTPKMAQSSSNEKEWWADTMQRSAASVVWRDVLYGAPFDTRDGKTPDDFWHAVRDGSTALRAIDEEPLLVIGREPKWLNEWRWRPDRGAVTRPADLTINRDPTQPQGYLFSMNETPVFRGQAFHGEAYLISRSLLKRALFHDYGDGVSVAVRFEDDPADAWSGTLIAEFQHKVELGDVPAYRIVYDSGQPQQTG